MARMIVVVNPEISTAPNSNFCFKLVLCFLGDALRGLGSVTFLALLGLRLDLVLPGEGWVLSELTGMVAGCCGTEYF